MSKIECALYKQVCNILASFRERMKQILRLDILIYSDKLNPNTEELVLFDGSNKTQLVFGLSLNL